MDKEKELPKRKATRLKNFDYSSAGAWGMSFAQCICKTNAKLAMKQNDK